MGIVIAEDLSEKLDVALKIFFILEVDNWACGLFIIQNGVLEESMFDQTMTLAVEDAEDKFKRDSEYLWKTLLMLFGMGGFIMIWSIVYHFAHNQDGDNEEDCVSVQFTSSYENKLKTLWEAYNGSNSTL